MELFFSISLMIGIAWLAETREKSSHVYLAGMMAGWLTAVVSFVFFISKQTYFQNMIVVSPGFWKQISSMNVPDGFLDFLISFLQLGLSLFLYCAFRYPQERQRHIGLKKQLLFMAPLLLELILYSPDFYKWIDVMRFSSSPYVFLAHEGRMLFWLVNWGYLLAAVGIAGYQYWMAPSIRVLKFKYFSNLVILGCLTFSFYMLFGWTPKVLIRPTRVQGLFLYNVPDIHHQLRFVNYFAVISMAILLVAWFLWYHYNKLVIENQSVEVNFRQGTQTAAMGMRVFTHSMKNELQAVLAETEYLEELCSGNEEAMYSLGLIRQSCQNAFDSVEMGNKVLKGRHLTLKKMAVQIPLRKSVEQFEKSHEQICLEYREDSEDSQAYVDETNLQEVFRNILNNSFEAIEDSPRRDAGRIRVQIKNHGSWVVIRFEDNGKGIREEEQSKIFEPFYSTKSSKKNWGIGLLFCRNIIETHGGQIAAIKKGGEGAVFEILLPRS